MSYFKRTAKNKQILSNQNGEKYAQTEITLNELDVNILRERIQLLEIENDKLRKENASLKNKSKSLISLKDNKTLISTSPVVQNIPNINNKLKGCNCKGNCANKICGCMKKDSQCTESCNCNVNSCKNKKKNKENFGAPNQAIPIRKKSQTDVIFPELLTVNTKQPIESVSSVDEVFYDATEPDFENMVISLDAVRTLTFLSEEDSPGKDAVELSAIQERDELNSKPVSRNKKKSENSNGKVKKNRKESSSSTVGEKLNVQGPRLRNKSRTKSNSSETGNVKKDRTESTSSKVDDKQEIEDPKVNKTRKKSASSKDSAANPKKERKGSKSKRTASVEIETLNEDNNKLLENPKVNSRSRKNKELTRAEEVKKQVKIQEPEIMEVESINDIPESTQVKNTKITGLSSSRESISNLKQPKDWKRVRSSVSVEKEEAEKETSKKTRTKKNIGSSFKKMVSRATRAISNDEITLESVQSRVRGLRRSLSSDAISHDVEKTTKRNTLQNSLSETAENHTERCSSASSTLNRSLSHDKLTKPFNNFISRVSSSFRRSKSAESPEEANHSIQKQEAVSFVLTPVKESPKNLKEIRVTEVAETEKGLTFDPMQPTRQLLRSPVPATPATFNAETQESSSDRFSLPFYGGYLSTHEMKVASPPPEILKDLCTEEVDLETFQTKLTTCKKCKRKFFPHRIQRHEAVCKKY